MAENGSDFGAADSEQGKLAAAYDKIMDKISDGDYIGNNESLLEECGVRDVSGEDLSDTVSFSLLTAEEGADKYADLSGEDWDGKTPILVVESRDPNIEPVAISAQGLYDFVHDDSRNDNSVMTSAILKLRMELVLMVFQIHTIQSLKRQMGEKLKYALILFELTENINGKRGHSQEILAMMTMKSIL